MLDTGARSVVARRELFGLLSDDGGRRVTLISAPAGSGKTFLLRSWIDDAGVRDRVAWVSVERDERDAQHFWRSVVGELRSAAGAEGLVGKLEPTPAFDGEVIVERLISGLGLAEEPVVLVIDDLHELRSADALSQLERLISRRPPLLRVVLASRHDPRLGLHRLRVAGDLMEIRTEDLRFSPQEARELLSAARIVLSDENLVRLHERTEGWAAGLRLAALALAGHREPDRFVAEFSGSERTVADYLFAEMLQRQPEDARRVLLRTSILEQVNGPLADVLTGAGGSRRILQELEEQNAFVFSVDASRSWFRYHHLFADLLRLQLERTEPDLVPELHRRAADWFKTHDEVVSAVRHAQAAEDWGLAARLLADHSLSLTLDGRGATVDTLLGQFPPSVVSRDPELARVAAAGEVLRGSLADAGDHLALAERNAV
jgi:LuxR family maltose regulon positive regulatory protein